MVSVKVNVEKCTGCGTCVTTCPMVVYELREVGGKTVSVVVAEDQCLICRACEVQCPEGAIEIIE
jgi:NAD-dependent dihydropyrimidine dehydrogenase PreA subunit